MEYADFVIRITLSLILGFAIGLERQLTGHYLYSKRMLRRIFRSDVFGRNHYMAGDCRIRCLLHIKKQPLYKPIICIAVYIDILVNEEVEDMDSDGSPQRDNQHLAFGYSMFACVIALVSK